MDQLTFFKTTLGLYDQHKQECSDGSQCSICFNKGLDQEEECSDSDDLSKRTSSQITETECTYPGGQCYELRMQECRDGATAGVMSIHGLWPQWGSECEGE